MISEDKVLVQPPTGSTPHLYRAAAGKPAIISRMSLRLCNPRLDEKELMKVLKKASLCKLIY